tara:strand:+ start:671 stop:949 length:279 start_codon:yes stop_codon:yes gene_type:complete
MNRVFFIILLVAFLVVPISINNVNDDGISYFDLAVEISENLFQETKIEEKKNFFLSENQKQLIREKLQGLSDSNNNLFNNFEEIQNENLKRN